MTSKDVTTRATPFIIANAFSKNVFGGNPAAIIFLNTELPDDTLLNIAKNFNQPIATFILPSATNEEQKGEPTTTEVSYHVRWFTTVGEIPLCGHGTLAAAGAIFSLGLVPSSVTQLNFNANRGGVLTAKRVGDWVEIVLPASQTQSISGEEGERLRGIVQRALGSPLATVKYVGRGGVGFEHQFVAEVDENDDLGGRIVDTSVFVSPYDIPMLLH